MPGPLDASFFNRPTLTVATELLGKFLVVVQPDGSERALMITEVEAYDGPEDLASHASRGRTERTGVMFGEAGRWYMYLIYGMYWMLNIVTGPEGYPAAILIRATGEYGGPGKLTKALGVDKRFNARPAPWDGVVDRRPKSCATCVYRHDDIADRRGICRPGLGGKTISILA